jgi:hypothetical protein
VLAEQGHLRLIAGAKSTPANGGRPMPVPNATPRKFEAEMPAKSTERPAPEQVALLTGQ